MWRSSTLQFLLQSLIRLPHLRITQMHLPIEMIRQPSIIVKPTEIGSTYITDLQLLMPRGTGRIRKGFEFSLLFFFGSLGDVYFMEFCDGCGDGAGFAEDGDFEEPGIDGAGEIGDLFELYSRVSIRRAILGFFACFDGRHTRSLVCLISSGVFSSRR